MKSTVLKIITIAALSSSAFASDSLSMSNDEQDNLRDLELKFGGWSIYSVESDIIGDERNSNHLGLGVAYYPYQSKNGRHRLGGELWYMKDAFDNNSYSAMASYKYRLDINYLIDSVDFGFNMGLINDTNRDYVYNNGSITGWNDSSETRIAALPYLTINATESMHLDISYSRHDCYSNHAQEQNTLFFRFGYRFKI